MVAVAPGNFPGLAQASQEVSSVCTYEADQGDLQATTKKDQGGFTADGHVDLGGCIWNEPDHGECVTTLVRQDGLGVGLGDLTLENIATPQTISTSDAQNTNSSVDCDLREMPISSGEVEITVSIDDDFWAPEQISGWLCTDSSDDDHIACESLTTEGEQRWDFCRTGFTTPKFDISDTNHVVVFVNGVANAAGLSDCGTDDSNPIGGLSGGIDDQNAGIVLEFDPV